VKMVLDGGGEERRRTYGEIGCSVVAVTSSHYSVCRIANRR